MACLNDIPSEHGRYAAVLKQGEFGPEIHLFERLGNKDILRLANSRAAGKFMRVLTGMKDGKTGKVETGKGNDAVEVDDGVILF